MASDSSPARGKGNVSENQFAGGAGDDIFGYMPSTPYSMMYGANNDELEIHPEEEAQVNIST